MSKELTENSNERRKIMECGKMRLVTWKGYRNIEACRDKMIKTKAHLELNMENENKDSEKGFYRHIRSKRKT